MRRSVLFIAGAAVLVAVVAGAVSTFLASRPSGVVPPVGARGGTGHHTYLVATQDYSDDSAQARVELVRDGRVVMLVGTHYFGGRASWSPDGSVIAWTASNDSISDQLFVAKPDGSGVRALVPEGASCTKNQGSCSSLSYRWAPGGHRLVLNGLEAGKHVQVVDAATGRTRDATPRLEASSYYALRWLPSGLLAYYRGLHEEWGPHQSSHAFMTAREDGSSARMLSPWVNEDYSSIDVSPDGRHLLVSGRYLSAGASELRYLLVDVPSGKRRWLSLPQGDSRGSLWAPDGSRLLIVMRTKNGTIGSILDVAYGRIRALSMPSDAYLRFLSSDGRLALSVRRNGRERLMTIGADGRNLRTLVTLRRGETMSTVLRSPDGRRIAFEVYRGDGFGLGERRLRVATVGIDGRGLRTIVTGASEGFSLAYAFRWWPDGDLTFSRGRELLETSDEPNAPLRVVYRLSPGAGRTVESIDRR